MLTIHDFHFDLPPELIAQNPTTERDASRLMVLDRSREQVDCRNFSDILECFLPGDLLVMNDTKVIPARLLGHKESGGKVEVLLVRRMGEEAEVWSCLIKASKSPKAGTRLLFDCDVEAVVEEGGVDGQRLVRFDAAGNFLDVVEQIGHIPLPPYIQRQDGQEDRERYQTVFARHAGAVAAPTAGLHFTESILEQLQAKGVELAQVTLHVGLGTFLPMRVEKLDQHRMHEEEYLVPEETARAIRKAKAEGRRVIALGTTTTRTLEHALDAKGQVVAGCGFSDLFIYPPHEFKVIDGLVTNFHLPESTLLMLVSAFAGREFVLSAYQRAIEERFRFFSYGDCMFIG